MRLVRSFRFAKRELKRLLRREEPPKFYSGQEITLLGTGKALTHNVEKTELDKNMTTKKYNFYRLILRFYRQCSCPFRKQSLKFLMPILSFPTVTSITGGPIPFLKFNENSTWALTSFFSNTIYPKTYYLPYCNLIHGIYYIPIGPKAW